MEEHNKEIGEEGKELAKLRSTIIQTQVVKIMKGRRKEKHNELITEVLKQITSFKPDPTMIKQQIEWLIESDYLMRDEHDKLISFLMTRRQKQQQKCRSIYVYKP